MNSAPLPRTAPSMIHFPPVRNKYTAGRTKGYETWLKQQEETVLKELNDRLESGPAKAKKAAKKAASATSP